MSFTDFFIKKPVFATVLSLVLFLTGLISYLKLPLREYPKIDATTISISTSYPGASPSIMESLITTPIENAVTGAEGLDYITSTNIQGESDVEANFKLGYDINAAISDVVNKVSSVRSELPKNIDDPIISKEDPNSDPILFLAISDPRLTSVAVNDYLVRSVQPVLATLAGVGEAKIFGGETYAMRIWLNPDLMAARNVSVDDVINAISNNNVQATTGRIQNVSQEFDTSLASQLSSENQFNNLIVRQQNNNLTRISDIGYAKIGTPESRVVAMLNGHSSHLMGIIPRSDANPLDVANVVKHQLITLQPQLPKGMSIKVVWDNAKFISASIKEVKKTIFEAALSVIVVIFLFLGSARTILIPSITIPLSLIGVCSVMYAMGYSLNTLTFLAFVLAIGMVVDDAIVVSENIHRNIDLGHSRYDAALLGAREIRFAIIAMTFTLAAVYAPIVFMQGLTGALFKEFAFTLACSVIISGFIALTLSPMMCSKILPEHGGNKNKRLENLVVNGIQKITDVYRAKLIQILNFRKYVLGFIAVTLVACAYFYMTIPQELAPKEDMGGLMTVISGPSSSNLQYTVKYAHDIDQIYKNVPEGLDRFLVVGYPNNVNSGLGFLSLSNWSQRNRSVDQIINSLFPQMMSIPGVLAFPLNPFSLPGSTSLMPISFVIKTNGSYDQLNSVVQKIMAAASQNPNITNLDVDLKIDKPQVDIDINRNLAADLGVDMSTIGTTLNIALGEPEINQFIMNGRGYYVIPQLIDSYRDTPQALNNLYVRGKGHQLVPLSSFITLRNSVAPQSLNHFQGMRAATISASPAPGHTLGQALTALEKITNQYITPNMQYDFSGQSRQFVSANGSMLSTFLFAIIFIFLILAAQFESFRDPLIVMFTVPLSTVGALFLLKITGCTMNVYTEIGLVTLIGLITKHGILMVEFANQLQRQGKEKLTAIIESAQIRLRPILMTTAAMILGAIPLVMSSGAGSVSRHQIGLTIVGGMLFGTLFTLFVVPTMYTLLAQDKNAQALR